MVVKAQMFATGAEQDEESGSNNSVAQIAEKPRQASAFISNVAGNIDKLDGKVLTETQIPASATSPWPLLTLLPLILQQQ